MFGLPRGDAARGLAEADVVVDAEDRTQVQTHVPMETHGDAAIVLGWVAPTPRRATVAEAALRGGQVTEASAREAAKAAVAGATPLSKNAYKVPILEAVLRRTILAAAGS
jgi:CO/xanthine dehydrogenase FAD-binding subunit